MHKLEGMKNTTVAIPNDDIDKVEILVNLGLYPSRSDFIRTAVDRYLEKELKNIEFFKQFKTLKMNQIRITGGN